jgi:hypothetical protein
LLQVWNAPLEVLSLENIDALPVDLVNMLHSCSVNNQLTFMLKSLTLSNNKLERQGTAELVSFVMTCKSLETLNVSNCSITFGDHAELYRRGKVISALRRAC